MNIHPALVHFPIALLVIYALMECMRWNRFLSHHSWNDIKAMFVILGTIAGFMALQSGEVAEHAFADQNMRQVIELHATFATASIWIFGILAAAYVVIVLTEHVSFVSSQPWWKMVQKIASMLLHWGIAIPLSLLGLVTMTITGALGGALTYGPDVDPIVSLIYHLFY